MNKAFFFDRDGIVNRRKMGDYVYSINEFEFLPHFFSLFKSVKESGFLAILITNQQGIGKGLMTEEALREIHAHMQRELLKETGFQFDDMYFCADLASANSFRRKPQPGMLLDAIKKWGIDAEKSWMIGDSISDAQAGKAAGVKTILIGDFLKDEADLVFKNLEDAEVFFKR
ncbi:MAG TPA: HAD family hydrolase [Patescibacteria group bacterium]|nr:HAD family hydrolase [Patescibacteria group bacterium]